MGKRCLFERVSGLYVGGSLDDAQVHDPATHIELILDDFPDAETQRWDGALGVRAATAQELSDVVDARVTKTVDATLASPLNLTLRDLLLDIEQRLRDAGHNSTLPDIAGAGDKAEYTAALKKILKSYL